jgi:hypothetical protein
VTYIAAAFSVTLYVWVRQLDPGVLPRFGGTDDDEEAGAATGKRYARQRLMYGLIPSVIDTAVLPRISEKKGWCGTSVERGPLPSAICDECKLHKPLRASHCSKTGRCIARFDHFCAWTGCAIGEGNHREFVLFLAALLIHLATAAWVCLLVGGMWGYGLAVLSGGFALYVSLIFVTQCWNMATDTTVRERLRGLEGGGRTMRRVKASPWAVRWPDQSFQFLQNCFRFWFVAS